MRSIRKKHAMEFDLAFTNKEIAPLGGMVFLSQFLNKIRFREKVDTCLSLPIQGSNSGHNVGGFIREIYSKCLVRWKSFYAYRIYTE